jgi:hypothetical protein
MKIKLFLEELLLGVLLLTVYAVVTFYRLFLTSK